MHISYPCVCVRFLGSLALKVQGFKASACVRRACDEFGNRVDTWQTWARIKKEKKKQKQKEQNMHMHVHTVCSDNLL